ncbi:zinc-binding alcohol dehydrogenase family protein [Actinacidiphila glaucinigra]|uniref:quinone oxidoreductase family protein n=1 Tax=Actinacidiphila glaucinigra TaxID=235986 RepID=UPI0036C8EBBC
MRAIVMRQCGGPDVLQVKEVEDPAARAGHVRVRVSLAGVSTDDVYARTGAIQSTDLPYTPGHEVVGFTDEGRRVVSLTAGGGYAEKAAVPAGTCWDVPSDIGDLQALTIARDGQAAWHALFSAAQIARQERIVVTAPGTTVGALAIQLAKAFDTTVIALAATAEEGTQAQEFGADRVVDGTAADLTDQVMTAAGGPVDAVVDLVGGLAIPSLLGAIAPRGRIALYGHVPPDAPSLSLQELMSRSISVAACQLPHMVSDHLGVAMSLRALWTTVRDGTLSIPSGRTYPLEAAPEAHRDLETRPGPGRLALAP